MKDTLVNKLASFRAAIAVADDDDNKPLWSGVMPLAFGIGLATARERVAALATKGAAQRAATTGSTDALRQLRTQFETALVPLTRATFRCLKKLDRLEDAAKCDLTPSDLHNARAQILAGMGETVLDFAEPLTLAPAGGGEPPGTPSGITAASVASMDTLWQNYSTAVGAPASARSRRKALTDSLPSDFAAAEEVFAELDDYILQFDNQTGRGHDFVEAWFNARRVADLGRRSARPATPASSAPASSAPAPAPKP